METAGGDDSIPWETLYELGPVEALPWYLDHLDPDVEAALAELDIHVPAVLDLGTGPGTQAIELARRGFDATGSDVSPSAVKKAADLAARSRVPCRFVEDDLILTRITRTFDFVIDRGLLHNIPPGQRPLYVHSVWKLLRPGGHLMVKAYRRHKPEPPGRCPYPFTAQELADLFRGSFDVLAIRQTVYHGRMAPAPPSWFAILRRH
jgi:SAM-dependent methyltransferase